MRSAIAVACCSRFSRVGALRMPPPSWTARAAAAEIWNGMSRSTARGSIGWPAASSSAGASPLRTPDSGSGHRLISSAYSAAPMPRMSSSGVASGSVAGNASATSPSMLTRTRLGWSIDSATPERWAASAAAASDWMARAPPIGDGDVSATSASEPPRIHSETTRPPEPVLATSSTRATPGMSMRLSFSVRDRISCTCSIGQRRVGVDEGQRHLAVQRGVQRLPELQVRRAAVEDQQPVAAAARWWHRGSGGRPRRRWRTRSAVRGAGRRRWVAGGIAAVVGGRAAGDRHRRGPVGGLRERRGLRGLRRVVFGVVGRHVGLRNRRPTGAGSWSWRCCRGPLRRRRGSSVTAGPFRIQSPATPAGGPRRAAAGIDDGVTRTNCSDQRT